jgi:hypothetical protein
MNSSRLDWQVAFLAEFAIEHAAGCSRLSTLHRSCQVDWKRKHDGRSTFARDIEQCREEAARFGALVGAFAGHYFIDRDKEEDEPGQNQVPFTVGVIALGAKMAKADGIVTRDEVTAFKEVFKVPEGGGKMCPA